MRSVISWIACEFRAFQNENFAVFFSLVICLCKVALGKYLPNIL